MIRFSGILDFYLPEIVMEEVKKFFPYIKKKSNLSEDQLKELLKIFPENITLVPMNKCKDRMNGTIEIMGTIDEKILNLQYLP